MFRFIPFLHSLENNFFDTTIFYQLGEILNYLIDKINNHIYVAPKISKTDLF